MADDVRLGPNPGLAFAAGLSQGLANFTTGYENAQKLQMQKQQMEAMAQLRQMQMQKLQAELAPVKASAAELALVTGMKHAGAEVPQSLVTDKYEKFFDSIKTPGQFQFAMSQVQSQVAKKQAGIFAGDSSGALTANPPQIGSQFMRQAPTMGTSDMLPKGDFSDTQSDMAAANGIKANQILGQEVGDIRDSNYGKQVRAANSDFDNLTSQLPQDEDGNYVIQPKIWKAIQDQAKLKQMAMMGGLKLDVQQNIAKTMAEQRASTAQDNNQTRIGVAELTTGASRANNQDTNDTKKAIDANDVAAGKYKKAGRGSGSSGDKSQLQEEKAALNTITDIQKKIADVDKPSGLIPMTPNQIAGRRAALEAQLQSAQQNYQQIRKRTGGSAAESKAAPAADAPVVIEATPQAAASAKVGALMNHPQKGWLMKKDATTWVPTQPPKGK